MGGGLLVYKRGGERGTWGGRIDKVVKTGGGGERQRGVCVEGGAYGDTGSYVREELIFILFIHPLNFCGLDA